MAPSSTSTRRRKAKARAKKPKSMCCKKQILRPKNSEETSMAMEDSSSLSSIATSSSSGPKMNTIDFDGISACSTPKAQKFRIPNISTCPPAPKKQRIVSNSSVRRRPIAFFAPPDLEVFFCFALGDISV